MDYELPEGDYQGPYKWFSVDTLRAEVAKAEKRGAEAMRERCAKECDGYDGSWYVYRKGAQECAAAIRSLK